MVAAADEPSTFDFIYPLDAPIEDKIDAIARRVYGADGINLLPAARDKIKAFNKAGLDTLPICMAKTHLSLSHDPPLANAPTGFTVTVRDLRAYTGAGWIVALCGDMQTMPGLGRPAAINVDIDERGETLASSSVVRRGKRYRGSSPEVVAPGTGRPTGDPLIRAEGIWKIFGKNANKVIGTPDADLSRAELREKTGCVAAVRDVSFEVWPGEVFVVMGLSGSGKSTLVRTLIRLIEPTAGASRSTGATSPPPSRDELLQLRRHTSSMVFQHFGLFAHRSVIDNVAFGLEVQGKSKAERLAARGRGARLVGLEDAANQFPDELSGGMQQRVGLARAFAVDPKVMLYDEPFSALDPLIRRDMQDEVIRLQHETGKTMVFITHDLPEALRLGDRIAIMRDGRVVQLGTPEDLVGSPADEYVSNFVRDIPRSHVLTLRWIMREPAPGETDGPTLDVSTTVRKAVPVIAASERPICAVENGRVVGVVDKEAVLVAIAGEGEGD